MNKRESYRNVRKEKYTQVSNSLLNDKEATLQAKGLLSIFLSNSEDWETNMAEIIKRSKNGRDAHYRIVNELIELGYFARIQVLGRLKNRFEEMVYIFSDIKQDVADELENIKKWAEDNDKDLIIEYKAKKEKRIKIESRAPFTENQEAENKYTKNKDNNNTKSKNTNLKTNNLNIDNIDDDKRTSSTVHNDEQIDLLISNFREATKEEISERSFKAVARKVVDKYNQGKVNSFRDYLATALIRKTDELEFRRQKENAKEAVKTSKRDRSANKLNELEIRELPFYNWLED